MRATELGSLTIGRVAKLSGVGVETVRYYQRSGILPKPPTVTSGFRTYSPEIVKRIRFIKRAQELGFSLTEVTELLSLRSSGRGSCLSVQKKTEQKLTEIDRKIADLLRLKEALNEVRKVCSREQKSSACPVLEEFYDLDA
jgi:Hg(II)-responsive transcriptional regulator